MTSIAEQQVRYNLSHPYKERKVIVGFTPRSHKPVVDVITRAYPSLLISGYPGQGKSSLVAYITGEFVKAQASAFVVDPHADAPEDSLADRLRPLAPRYVTLTDFDLDRIMEHLQFLWDEYLARHAKGGCEGKETLLTVVDEWNELLRLLDKEQKELAIKVVSLLAKGGRKYGMFVCLIAHNVNLEAIGGRDVGGSLQGRITLFADLATMRKTLDCQDTKAITALCTPALCPGQGIMRRNVPGVLLGMQRFHWPEITAEGMQALADLMDKVGGIPEYAPLKQSESESETQSEPQSPKITLLLPTPTPEQTARETLPDKRAEPQMSVVGGVSEADFQAVVQAGNRQLISLYTHGRKPRLNRKAIQRDLREKSLQEHEKDPTIPKRWDADDYKIIQKVCDFVGWHVGFTLEEGVTDDEWEQIKAQQDYRCAGCGGQLPLERDHVQARSRAGKTVGDNLQGLCRSCNAKKGARHIDYRTAPESEEAS
jgi:5-methylcytosine-specific restriction endonuclease McrA